MAKPKQPTTVVIAGRPYSLLLQEADQPTLVRLVKELNDKVRHFQTNYPKRDKQDLLAMSLLTYAVDLHKQRSVAVSPLSDTNLSDALLEIDHSLNDLLTPTEEAAE